MRSIGVLLLLLCGCRQLLGFEEPVVGPTDGTEPDTLVIPDAGSCQALSAECIGGTVLRACTAIGEQPTDTTCSWGCVDLATPHCAELQPAGGAVVPADLVADAALEDITTAGGGAPVVVNADTGQITGLRGAGTGVVSGIDFFIRNNVAVFRMRSLTVMRDLVVVGSRPVAVIALGDIEIQSIVDLRGGCVGRTAGPGGGSGGDIGAAGVGPGAGGRGTASADNGGGGGGGYGALGGPGGAGLNAAGGTAGIEFGDATILTLVGGSGGGGGAPATTGSRGGGGGGAIQLLSNTQIQIAIGGGINASGCGGGLPTNTVGGGGGGGAGGTILLEAPTIIIGGGLAVNGGAGAGGTSGSTSGENGSLSTLKANGGINTGQGGPGGDGGAAGDLSGDLGGGDNGGGGGGGAVGRIRLHTKTGTVQLGAGGFTSPRLTDIPTTATEAAAVIQ